jgi:hypothetical protein
MYVLEFLSLKVLLQKKEACGYAKVIRKKEKKKRVEKK